jgi:hypothetical protein
MRTLTAFVAAVLVTGLAAAPAYAGDVGFQPPAYKPAPWPVRSDLPLMPVTRINDAWSSGLPVHWANSIELAPHSRPDPWHFWPDTLDVSPLPQPMQVVSLPETAQLAELKERVAARQKEQLPAKPAPEAAAPVTQLAPYRRVDFGVAVLKAYMSCMTTPCLFNSETSPKITASLIMGLPMVIDVIDGHIGMVPGKATPKALEAVQELREIKAALEKAQRHIARYHSLVEKEPPKPTQQSAR